MIRDEALLPLADELSKADSRDRTDALIRLADAARELGAWQHELTKADDEPLIEALETWVGNDKIRRAALDSVLADQASLLTKRAAGMALEGDLAKRGEGLFRLAVAAGKRTAKTALGAVGGAVGAVERGVSSVANTVAGPGTMARRTVTGAKRVVDQMNAASGSAGARIGEKVGLAVAGMRRGAAIGEAKVGRSSARDATSKDLQNRSYSRYMQGLGQRRTTWGPALDAARDHDNSVFRQGMQGRAINRAGGAAGLSAIRSFKNRHAAAGARMGRMLGSAGPAAAGMTAAAGAAALTDAQLRQRREAAKSGAEKRRGGGGSTPFFVGYKREGQPARGWGNSEGRKAANAMKADEAIELLKNAPDSLLEELMDLEPEEQLEVADALRELAEEWLDIAAALEEEGADIEKADAVAEDWLLRDGLKGLELRKSALSVAAGLGRKAMAVGRLGRMKAKGAASRVINSEGGKAVARAFTKPLKRGEVALLSGTAGLTVGAGVGGEMGYRAAKREKR